MSCRASRAGSGLGDRVGFVPFQRDVAPVYRALDVVVHASTKREPFGLSVLEAMACGRPVIVSDAGGVRELVTHGDQGLTHPPGDVDALAGATLRRCSMIPRAASASARADARPLSPCSIGRVSAAALADIYLSLGAAPAAADAALAR